MGLLTPLTFARHRLSPLASFTSSAYFLHNGRRWQWACELYTASCKGVFWRCFWRPIARCVWQKAITCCLCYRMPQNTFFPWTRDLLVSQKTTQRHFIPTLHPLSPVIFATATVVAFVLLHNSRFNFHCYTQHDAVKQRLLRNRPGSDAVTSHDFLHKRLQRAFTHANQHHWTTQ